MPALYTTVSEVYEEVSSLGTLTASSFSLTDIEKLRSTVIDRLVYTSVFASSDEVKQACRTLIQALAVDLGIHSASHAKLYQAIGSGDVHGFTVPAMNIRVMTYDSTRHLFRQVIKQNVGAFIIELARSEMGYSFQTPSEFATSVLAAAIKEGYSGHVFLQGDHYQVKEKAYKEDPEKELSALQDLIKESLTANIFNIDIDASTVVDLSKPSLLEQQQRNSQITAELTNFIRSRQPEGITVSVGGEIGHIGDRNSTPEDFTAFMNQYLPQLQVDGITKVSAQTGSSHGGMVDSEGKLKEVTIDFSVIDAIGKLSREVYHMGGFVQHGASTLPIASYPEFVTHQTLEIHLSTAFQNIVFDHLPSSLLDQMKQWVIENCQEERKPEWNDLQFFYKLRKKSIGPFKEALWSMSDEEKAPIFTALESEFAEIFTALNVVNTKDVIATYV